MAQQYSMKFRTKLYAGYAVILALMTIVVAVVYLNIAAQSENTRRVEHTYAVIRAAEKCSALLVDMETGVRGFLVAGKEEFLEPYQDGIADFVQTWADGKELTRDNPVQLQRWNDLKALKERWLKEIALKEIALRREVREGENAFNEFRRVSNRIVGKEIFDTLRGELGRLKDKFFMANNKDGTALINFLTIDLLNQETGQRGFMLTGREESLAPFTIGLDAFHEHFKALEKIDYASAGISVEEITTIDKLADTWIEKAAKPEIEARREVNKYPRNIEDVTVLFGSGVGKRLMDDMRQVLAALVAEEEKLLAARIQKTSDTALTTVLVAIAGLVLSLLIGAFVSFYIVRDVSRQLGSEPAEIERLTQRVARGDIDIEFASEGKIVTGVYAATITMVENLHAVVRQADAVSKGDYAQQVTPRSNMDTLGNALVRMIETLRTISAQNERESRLRNGQAELNDIIRGDHNKVVLTESVITYLADYFGAQVGAFYLAATDGMLELTASYAYRKCNDLSSRFAVGESLVGQAARERKPIIISEVPEDYIRITSGLGNAVPNTILLYPIVLMDDLKGVIELGSLRSFSDEDLEFMDQVGENIAIALNSADARQHVQDLLEQSQAQSEELAAQQQELLSANQSLKRKTTALTESEANLKAQQEELRVTNEQLQAQQEELRVANEELEDKTGSLENQKEAIACKNSELEEASSILAQKARELEISSRYKSEFLANMSHELRTPLNSLLLISKKLSRNKERNLTEKQVESAEIIYNSGNSLLTLINEILDLAKIESGKMEIVIGPVAYADIKTNMENIFSYSMEEKGLDFSVEIDQQLPPDLQTDQQRLEQMLKNLLSNALKFTQTGSVTLAMKKPAADMDLSGSGLCPEESSAFSVIDTGIGVPESNQLEIFEAFQQADGTTSRQYGGTGLGLSITREFVKLMGGEIQLDSREGHGSTFTIFLPQEAVGGTSTLKERLPDSSAAKVSAAGMLDSAYSRSIPDDRERLDKNDKVVLMIEDDMQFAKVLYEVCREKGFKCIHAAAGEKGINMAEAYRPHAIILDLSLPGISGWQVLDMLKDNIHTRHIPVHIISASEKTVDALMKGAVGYLTKPVSEDQLEDVLGRLDKMISKETKDLLIVEDDTDLRDGIQGLFDSDAISITATGSGREALGLIRQKQFDCVILDLRLPDITGFEVLKEISAIDGYPAPPVVIYTGTELSDSEQLELSKYADSVIIKGAKSDERLVAETTLFLHTVTDDLHGAGRGRMEELQNVDGFIKGKKVLTVDDDMRNLFALTEELEELGMVVVKATNGREALAVLEKDADIDIVLMDIMMPVMDGYEAMRNIRQQPGLEDLPILALTAKAMREDRSKCIEAGANDYIPKPVDLERLLSTMRVWLKK